jgi:hypothetical protein
MYHLQAQNVHHRTPKVDNGQHQNVSAHLPTHTEWENGHSGQTKRKKNQALQWFKVFCVNGWVLEIAPNLHWVSSQVSELITGVIQNSNIWFWYIITGIKKIKYFFIFIYNCSSQFSLKKTQIITLKLLVSLKFLKYPEPAVLRFFFPKYPKLMGITEIKYPTPRLVWTGGCLVHSLAVSTISVGFTFGKELHVTRYIAPRHQILDFPSFNFQAVKQIVSNFIYYLFIWCGAGARGGECDSKMGLKRCIRILKWDHCRGICWNA